MHKLLWSIGFFLTTCIFIHSNAFADCDWITNSGCDTAPNLCCKLKAFGPNQCTTCGGPSASKEKETLKKEEPLPKK